MTLKILSAVKSLFGQWEITLRINGKNYNYFLSDYGYQKAMSLYNKGLQGKALSVINEYQEVTS
jgi:hypothetical protein